MKYIFVNGFEPLCELIDTQWDVNVFDITRFGNCGIELIDTQWDVNENGVLQVVINGCELIDTQWDVNADMPAGWTSGNQN